MDLSTISWDKFKKMLLIRYFSERVKRHLEQDMRKLQQKRKTMAEYEQKIFPIINGINYVVRDDRKNARMFKD